MIDLSLVAQQLNLNQLLYALKPGDFWGWLCYLVIVFDVLLLLLQKQSRLLLTVFIAISIVAALINELGSNGLAGGPGVFGDMLRRNTFANWMVGIVMFVLPLVVVGMTKTPRSRLPGLLATVFAMIFVFGRWFLMPK